MNGFVIWTAEPRWFLLYLRNPQLPGYPGMLLLAMLPPLLVQNHESHKVKVHMGHQPSVEV